MLPALIGLLACATSGCGGGGESPKPAPTLDAVSPTAGSILGGTSITITGANLLSDSTVAIDGQAATAVMVDGSGTSLSCLTPAGASPGAKDVTVSTSGGTASLAGAFTYFPPPTVTSVVDDRGSTSGGLGVTVHGTGFVVNAAGTNTVRFGDTPATAVVVVDDLTITCTTPAGSAGSASVSVSNDNGVGVLPTAFLYVVPLLYAADGRSGTSGNLYVIDVADGSATTIGPIGYPITGLAFGPDGVLYGVTSANAPVSTLVAIDVTTGVGTAVAPLVDGGMAQQGCTDISVVGTRLLGWGQPNKTLNQRVLEIDPLTGIVTDLGGGTVGGGGNAFEADRAGVLRLVRTLTPTRTVFDVDPVTGVATLDQALTPNADVINSMAFLDGVLYCVDSNNISSPPNDLATIDPVTGVVTKIGALPNGVDGIAGTIK